MKNIVKPGYWLAVFFAGMLSGCTASSTGANGFTRSAIQPGIAGTSERGTFDRPSAFLDRDIARDLDAAFLGNRLHVRYEVSNRVVTLTGDVNSQSKRARAERLAAAVVNVRQVVNELRVQARQFRSGKQ
jgi:BON domain-containing protein